MKGSTHNSTELQKFIQFSATLATPAFVDAPDAPVASEPLLDAF